MSLLFLIKTLHVLSAAVLFGTGLGIAFFMAMANRSGDPRTIATVGRMVVKADLLFTATAVVVQPLTGLALMRLESLPLRTPWLVATYGLYGLIGACWLPVVWIQVRMRRLAQAAADSGEPLPTAYRRLYRVWAVLGWPAFLGVIGIYGLMLFKPV